MTDSVINPQSNRFVKVGTQKYKRLVREGIIKPIEQVPPQVPTPSPEPEPLHIETPSPEKTPKFNEDDYHTKMRETFQQIVKENEEKLVDLSQKQCDQLLKKLLYQKLCVDKPEEKPKKKTKNKKKKNKFKIVQPPSSSSESESTEDSE